MKESKKGMANDVKCENETTRVICSHCKSKLEITPKQVSSVLNLLDVKYYFKCNSCGAWSQLDFYNLTENFKRGVRQNNQKASG